MVCFFVEFRYWGFLLPFFVVFVVFVFVFLLKITSFVFHFHVLSYFCICNDDFVV